ncbi:MAG TPA: hypothetical protein VM582_01280, partial [Candidatus Thermoplasmatota archaeon]|nr:hypothetical protein [Candidatus Thermoplasmatota archaeon]
GPDYRPPSSVPPVCPDTLTAQAQEDGSVLLTWDAANEDHNDVMFYRIIRDRVTIAEVQTTSYLDDATVGGETYAYRVEAHGAAAGGGTTWTGCGSAEVTAVPFFGAPLLGALALAGSVGAYAFARRRT